MKMMLNKKLQVKMIGLRENKNINIDRHHENIKMKGSI